VYRVKQGTSSFGTAAGSLASGAGGVLAGLSAANFRGGETLFDDNQVSLRAGPGGFAGHVSSVLILALDDVGFADNQCELEAEVAFCIVDALLMGLTLRATGNRLQEAALCFGSLASMASVLNTTSLNQSTFFTFASGPKLVDTNNLTIL